MAASVGARRGAGGTAPERVAEQLASVRESIGRAEGFARSATDAASS